MGRQPNGLAAVAFQGCDLAEPFRFRLGFGLEKTSGLAQMGADRDNSDVCCCADMEEPQVLGVSWSQVVAHAVENVNIPSMTVADRARVCVDFHM